MSFRRDVTPLYIHRLDPFSKRVEKPLPTATDAGIYDSLPTMKPVLFLLLILPHLLFGQTADSHLRKSAAA